MAVTQSIGTIITGGAVQLNYVRSRSSGVNIYGKRGDETDWNLLGRSTKSPFVDHRPLLVAGKPELRTYTVIFMKNDTEIGFYSADVVINCAP